MNDQMHLALIINNGVSPHSIGAWRLPHSYQGFDFARPQYWHRYPQPSCSLAEDGGI